MYRESRSGATVSALTPQDQEAVLAGYPRVGMRTDARRFFWGAPYYTQGSAKRYAHWYYLGSPFALTTAGNQYGNLTFLAVRGPATQACHGHPALDPQPLDPLYSGSTIPPAWAARRTSPGRMLGVHSTRSPSCCSRSGRLPNRP
jgi:hypothetical protein